MAGTAEHHAGTTAVALSPDRILELGFSFWASKALLSAFDLGLFTELARRPAMAEELRERLGLRPRAAREFFDALLALGMLERDGAVYRTPATDLLLDRAKPSSMGGILEILPGPPVTPPQPVGRANGHTAH
jgi:hypothetical protein